MLDAHGAPGDEDLLEEERIAVHNIPVVATLLGKARARLMSGSCLIDVSASQCMWKNGVYNGIKCTGSTLGQVCSRT